MIHFLIHLFSCFFVVVFEVKTIQFSIHFKDNAKLCTELHEWTLIKHDAFQKF